MIRTQIYLDEALVKRLRRAASAQRRTVSAVIREALARSVPEDDGADADPLRNVIGMGRGGPRDASINHDRYLYGSDLDAERRRR